MGEREFGGLIVSHRKSAVFFKRISDISIENRFHPEYFSQSELSREYTFTDEEWQEFYEYCLEIANEAWSDFTPKEATSLGSNYDDYYDREFDNNGSLRVGKCIIRITGPYAQPKNKIGLIRLIKFNKRKFESFVFDVAKHIYENPELLEVQV